MAWYSNVSSPHLDTILSWVNVWKSGGIGTKFPRESLMRMMMELVEWGNGWPDQEVETGFSGMKKQNLTNAMWP